MNLKGPRKGPTFDPDDSLRRTLKEEYSYDSARDNSQITTHRRVGRAHDPDDIARATLKEESRDGTFSGAYYRPTQGERVVDDDDYIETTIKDLTHVEGHVQNAGKALNSAYAGAEYVAPPTIRESSTLNDRESSSATRGNGDAYRTIDVEAPNTLKQDVKSRTGNSGASSLTKAVSYEQMYNAAIDGLKESTVVGRDFVESSAKVFSSDVGERTRSGNQLVTSRDEFPAQLIPKTTSRDGFGAVVVAAETAQPPGPFDIGRRDPPDWGRRPQTP